MVGAGYLVYGSSTVLVYTDGQTVDSFTLDPSSGEYFLTRSNMKMPDTRTYLSINECNAPYWPGWVHSFVTHMKGLNEVLRDRYLVVTSVALFQISTEI